MTDHQHAAAEPGAGSEPDAGLPLGGPGGARRAPDRTGPTPGPAPGTGPHTQVSVGHSPDHSSAPAAESPAGADPTEESPGSGAEATRAHDPGAGASEDSGTAGGPEAATAHGPGAGREEQSAGTGSGGPGGREAGVPKGPGAGGPGAGGPEAGAFASPSSPPPVPTKFRRDRQYKMLAGVCSGLGRQCDMDPVIFRIVLAVLSATGGLGLLFYGFAWLSVPYDDEEENEVRKLFTGRVDGQALTAVLFALVGCGVFLTMLTNGGVLTFAVVLALLLAGAGYWSQQRGAPFPDPLTAQAVADAPPEAQAPPVPAAHSSWWRDPIVKDGTHEGGTGYLWGPSDSRKRDIAAAHNIARGVTPRRDIPSAQARIPKPCRPRWTGGWIFLLALLAGGLGAGLTWDGHALGTSLQTGLACALGVFGLGIALSAFFGRTGAGTVLLAVITAVLLVCSAGLPAGLSSHWVRKTWTPSAAVDVRPLYELGTGVGTLNLSKVDVPKDRTVTTSVELGVGKIRLLVPPDTTVRLTIEVGIGDIQLPGEGREDVDVSPDKRERLTLRPVNGSGKAKQNGGTLDVILRVGVGQAEVSRAAS